MKKNRIDPDNIPFWLQNYWSRLNYKNIVAGINDDDCAVISLNETENLVITTDFLNANPISVELGICNAYDLGRIIVASNISDLCGTGAKPLAFLFGVTMTHEDELDDLYGIFKGIKAELQMVGIPLVGGDTKLGKSRAFHGTAIGIANDDRKLYIKNKAKPNDIIWVSNTIGLVSSSVYGLSLRLMGENWNNKAKQSILNPRLPLDKAEYVATSKFGNGGTDISDGLGADLTNILDSSNVGAVIDAEKIPCSPITIELAEKLKLDPWLFSFIIGGDFQFIVTTDKKYSNEMKKKGFFEIGHTTEEKEKLLIVQNRRIMLPNFGHRDERDVTFSEEVKSILNNLKREIYDFD